MPSLRHLRQSKESTISAPYTPERNGVVERDNRTVMKKALSMLQAKEMPKKAWAEVVSCAVYLLNRTPCQKTGLSSYEKFFGKKPYLNHLRKFGSVAYELVSASQRNKLQPKVNINASRSAMIASQTTIDYLTGQRSASQCQDT